MKSQYDHYSKVYDLFTQEYYEWCFRFIESAIRTYRPNSKSFLEIACGTGNILQHFAGKYEAAGLDLSPSMLAYAKKKLPNTDLFEKDMSDFQLNRKFDVIVCMFDSINHLTEFEDWISTFKCVRDHLYHGGVFIFDMNTQERLDLLTRSPGFVQQTDEAYLIMKVSKVEENLVNWNVKIFRRKKDNLFELGEDNIKEAAFSQEKVQEELSIIFEKVHTDVFKDGLNALRGRVLFTCQV